MDLNESVKSASKKLGKYEREKNRKRWNNERLLKRNSRYVCYNSVV